MANDLKRGSSTKASKPKTKKKAAEYDGPIYNCSRCGKKYIRQKDNFNYSPSPTHKGNGGYLTICKNCINEMYTDFTDNVFEGDHDKAAEMLCAITNTCFDETAWYNAKRVPMHRSKMSTYFSKLNLSQTKGFSYTDTILLRRANEVQNITSIKEAEENPKYTTSIATIRTFGLGFTDSDYETLQYEYDDWVQRYGLPDDKRQDELYKGMCYLKLQLQKSVQNGDTGVGSLAKAYKEYVNTTTIELEDRIQKKEEDAKPVIRLDPLGILIRDIEQYTPAEYYKDKPLYNDADGIGGYATRFIFRPLKNLLTGTKELDKEFSLADTED